ncbi:MAG: hypothetical protein ACI4WS_09590 [Oscillospiraceae bacterium]
MGLLDIFGRKQTAHITSVNLTENGFELNGIHVDLPTHISVLEKMLGKPRGVSFKNDEETEAVLGNTKLVSRRVNYAWDDIGLYCYTKNGTVVSTFGILISTEGHQYKYNPHSSFSGTLMIDGRPWLDVMKDGEDTMPLRRYVLGGYSIIGEYLHFGAGAAATEEKDFTTIEIQLC